MTSLANIFRYKITILEPCHFEIHKRTVRRRQNMYTKFGISTLSIKKSNDVHKKARDTLAQISLIRKFLIIVTNKYVLNCRINHSNYTILSI